jgi:hypothetical protein
VFLLGDATGHKNAEMADAFVDCVIDGLPMSQDIVIVLVAIEYPTKRLLRWRDIVPFGREADDRRADIAQVDPPVPEVVGFLGIFNSSRGV